MQCDSLVTSQITHGNGKDGGNGGVPIGYVCGTAVSAETLDSLVILYSYMYTKYMLLSSTGGRQSTLLFRSTLRSLTRVMPNEVSTEEKAPEWGVDCFVGIEGRSYLQQDCGMVSAGNVLDKTEHGANKR